MGKGIKAKTQKRKRLHHGNGYSEHSHNIIEYLRRKYDRYKRHYRNRYKNFDKRKNLGNGEGKVFFSPAIERFRLVLMFFMCINLFGFPGVFGGLIKEFCGFTVPAFFMLSGFLVLYDDKNRTERIKRTMKRSVVVFSILSVVYFIINYIYSSSLGVNILSYFSDWRFWFNFLIMDIWQFQIGGVIWYVQALLYAYIIIYFLNKKNLLRFDIIISAVLIVFTILTGELSGIFKWDILGYTYIPGNFFTRALPYILLGGFIGRNMEKLGKIKRIWYYVGFVVGVALMFSELVLLDTFNVSGYYGHLVGMPIVAFSMCMLTFTGDDNPGIEKYLGMSRWHTNCIYYLCQPVGLAVMIFLSILGKEAMISMVEYSGIITFIVCFIIVCMIALVGKLLFGKDKDEKEN